MNLKFMWRRQQQVSKETYNIDSDKCYEEKAE